MGLVGSTQVSGILPGECYNLSNSEGYINMGFMNLVVLSPFLISLGLVWRITNNHLFRVAAIALCIFIVVGEYFRKLLLINKHGKRVPCA
jgi:hypothetical protein